MNSWKSVRIAQMGLALVPEGRQIFPNLSVTENLLAFRANRCGTAEPPCAASPSCGIGIWGLRRSGYASKDPTDRIAEAEWAIGMRYNHDIRHRRFIRLQGYDHSPAGVYSVTLCAQHRERLFGGIVNGEMRLNETGEMVTDEWMKTAEIRNEIELDQWGVMPNHFHGILVIAGGWGAARRAPLEIRETTTEYAKEAWMV